MEIDELSKYIFEKYGTRKHHQQMTKYFVDCYAKTILEDIVGKQ